ncbi:cytosine permease [Fibrobacter sp.]|uniref:cytosine permease n=1 Tax=Fibrobacter sp. TaxID=35828 RepID=UPI00388D5AB3
MNQRTGIFANGLIWFGAAVSVAEIEAGIQSGNNWAALIAGHLLGGLILFAVGLIGARLRLNAMETTATAFGKSGSKFFALLNLLQLVGWTAVMIAQGTTALGGLENSLKSPMTSIGLALVIAIWLFVGIKRAATIATVGMSFLAVLFALLTFKIFGGSLAAEIETAAGAVTPAAAHQLSFWSAFEISVAMPLSWLPLISDYTKNAEKPFAGTLVSAVVYTLVSMWMYAIGIVIGTSGICDIPSAILAVGFGVAGVAIVAFSTIATTFLDAYSSGESASTICSKLNPKVVGCITCAVGAVLAISGIIDRYTDFLYLIASVFAPMAAVLLVSHYFVRNLFVRWNLFSWFVGFVAYHVASGLSVEFIGPTIIAMLISAIFAFAGCLMTIKSAS